MTAKKLTKLYEETVEISGDSGPDGFGDMPLGEKRKNLIKWIKDLTGVEEEGEEKTEAANDSTETATPVAEEAVDAVASEVGTVNDKKTADKEDKSEAKETDGEDTVSEGEVAGDLPKVPEPETSKETPKKEEPAKEAKAADKKAKAKAKADAAKKTPDAAPDSDPIHAMAKKIETINDVAAIEELAIDLLQQDKVNEFQSGGYLLRLQNWDEQDSKRPQVGNFKLPI